MLPKIKTKLKSLGHYVWAVLANWYYRHPSRQLVVIGVTGTKGKSTTCRYIASVLEAGGYTVGLLSTVEFQIGAEHIANKKQMTMLGRGMVQKMLRKMVDAGCQYAVVETSSEGILQFRHLGIEYDIAVFTNLGTEHQERHGGFENLKRDKGKLFGALSKYQHKVLRGKTIPKIIVANSDSEHAPFYLNFPADQKYVFGRNPTQLPTFHETIAHTVIGSAKGVEFTVQNYPYVLNLVGDFNVYNALPAIVIGETQGLTPAQIAKGLASVAVVAGRMEFIECGQNYKVVVDYAHEPMSLTALFSSLRSLVLPSGRLVGIVGSDGGGRDKLKRGRMGAVAGELCDIVVVADVNPWDEDPNEIAEMLAAGARSKGKIDGKDLFIIIDRYKAIDFACAQAGVGGVVAITAKGTESSIIVNGGKKIPWDDCEKAREVIGNRLT